MRVWDDDLQTSSGELVLDKHQLNSKEYKRRNNSPTSFSCNKRPRIFQNISTGRTSNIFKYFHFASGSKQIRIPSVLTRVKNVLIQNLSQTEDRKTFSLKNLNASLLRNLYFVHSFPLVNFHHLSIC